MLERKKDYHAWLYLGIPFLLIGIFTVYPLIKTFLISFDEAYSGSQDAWGMVFNFNNYINLFKKPGFRDGLYNTILIVFITVPISTLLALLIAVGLNSIKPLQKIFQTIFFLPYVTNTIAIGMVFAVMFDQNAGLINFLLGISKNWIGDGANLTTQRFVLHTYIIWNALPFKILVFIGGLQNIGKQYYDAAKIDATPKRRVLSKITIPLLSPMISYVLITSFIGSFKSYESVLGVFSTAMGQRDMQTIVGFIYDNTSRDSDYVYGAAASVVLLIIILIFTLINLQVSKKRVHY